MIASNKLANKTIIWRYVAVLICLTGLWMEGSLRHDEHDLVVLLLAISALLAMVNRVTNTYVDFPKSLPVVLAIYSIAALTIYLNQFLNYLPKGYLQFSIVVVALLSGPYGFYLSQKRT